MSPQSFWRSFLRKYWDRRPAKIEKPPIPPLIDKPELFDVLVQQAELYRKGTAPVLFRAYIDDTQYSLRPQIEALLPEALDRSLENYAARIEATLNGQSWGLILNAYYKFSELHRMRLLDFGAGVMKNIGMVAGGVLADLYVGTYRYTPFGIHKDEQHIFTWIVHGQKRILTWPFECFADVPGVNADHRTDAFVLPFKSNIPRKEEAMLLEGTEGDLFYWPSSFWHIAVSQGEFVATAAVGVVPEERPLRVISDALQTFAKTAYVNRYVQSRKLIGNENDLIQAVHTLRKLIRSSRFDDVVEQILQTRTKTIYLKDAIQYSNEPALSSANAARSDIQSTIVWRRRGKRNVSLRISEDVVFRTLGDEAVLLNLASGGYFGLDSVGCRMWGLLSEHGSTEKALTGLLAEYEVDETQLRRDLDDLIRRLLDNGLLKLDAK